MKRSLLLALLLAGCAEDYQVILPPGRTMADLKRDAIACRYEAMKVSPANSYGGAFAVADARNELENMCAQAKGYQFGPRRANQPVVVYQ